jgi:hypothetical protein
VSVQLAPQHKLGLALRRPLLVANCTAELLGLLDPEVLGAVVAPELGGRARRPRRVVERPGGFLLAEGRGAFSLTGLRHLLRAAGGLAVIARVCAGQPAGPRRSPGQSTSGGQPPLWGESTGAAGRGDLRGLEHSLNEGAGPDEPHRSQRSLTQSMRRGRASLLDLRGLERLADEGVSAFELDLLPGDPESAGRALEAARAATDLPLLARVPLLEAVPYALACAEAGADALVVAAPPRGLAVLDDPAQPQPVEVHGPLLHPLTLLALQQVAEAVDLPLVARGGILTLDDARAFLAQGAAAVAVDSLALVSPAVVVGIGRGLNV